MSKQGQGHLTLPKQEVNLVFRLHVASTKQENLKLYIEMFLLPGISLLNILTRPIPRNKTEFIRFGIMKHKNTIFKKNTTLHCAAQIYILWKLCHNP